MALRLVGTLNDHATQRLAQLQARFSARLASKLDDGTHLGDLLEQLHVECAALGPGSRKTESGWSSVRGARQR